MPIKKFVTPGPDSQVCVPFLKLGFLGVLEEPRGYMGGYLITNAWGQPLEFRVSNPVQPSRVQQILYGHTLRPYIFAELISRTLVENAATSVEIIITDSRPVLDLRRCVRTPMVWLAGKEQFPRISESGVCEPPVTSVPQGNIYSHPEFAADQPIICKLIKQLPNCLDLSEPFQRIREAIGEARKMGIMSRAS